MPEKGVNTNLFSGYAKIIRHQEYKTDLSFLCCAAEPPGAPGSPGSPQNPTTANTRHSLPIAEQQQSKGGQVWLYLIDITVDIDVQSKSPFEFKSIAGSSRRLIQRHLEPSIDAHTRPPKPSRWRKLYPASASCVNCLKVCWAPDQTGWHPYYPKWHSSTPSHYRFDIDDAHVYKSCGFWNHRSVLHILWGAWVQY